MYLVKVFDKGSRKPRYFKFSDEVKAQQKARSYKRKHGVIVKITRG